MTTLSERLASSAGAAVDQHADEWLAKGLEAARKRVAERREDLLTATLPTSVRERQRRADERALLDHADVGLAAVDRHAPALVQLGRDLAAAVTIQLGGGRRDEARRLVLASRSTLAQRLAASAASTARTAEGTDAHERAVDDAIAGLEDVGSLALRAAIPFLLAAL